MKKFLCVVLSVLMLVACLTACGGNDNTSDANTGDSNGSSNADNTSSDGETIKVGILGCHTGEYATYGLGVKNGAMLYIDEVNANGGINGKQIEPVIYDNKGDNSEAINAFSRMVDEGITALIGDVLTGNTIAVVGEAYPINMPMITPSATAEAVTYDAESDTVYSNVFRTCFLDPDQGKTMANYAKDVLGAKTAAILFETGSDYSVGLKDAFVETCKANGIEVVQTEGFATGDKDFKAQLTNINAKNPDVLFVPAYYETDGLIVTQAREVGIKATLLGGDGWAGIADYASAEDLQGSYYCSGYAPDSTDAVKDWEAKFTAKYDKTTMNMFAATAYDAAAVLCHALEVAESKGLKTGSDEYKQAVIDAIRDDSKDVKGITSDGYTFDEHNNPIKSFTIMTLDGGKEVYKETY